MRCLALAQAAQDVAMDVTIVGRISVPWVRERLSSEGIPFVVIDDTLQEAEDPVALLQQLCLATLEHYDSNPKSTWVVLDGYHFGPDCHKAVMAAGHKLLVIDDYNHLPEYHCDILLNQNVGAEQFVYHGNIGQKCLGLEYVLLRREFLAARSKAAIRNKPTVPQNILITLGGGDFSAFLPHVASCCTIEEMRGKKLRIIAGAMPEQAIKDAFASCPAEVEILTRVADMPALLLDTDLCITAGGSTCWELMCLGIPFLLIEIAQNQRGNIEFLDTQGIAKVLQISALSDALRVKPPVAPCITGEQVDGKGALRVLRKMQPELHGTLPLVLRPAQKEDSLSILEIVNDPLTRAMSFVSSQITLEEHVVWFDKQLLCKNPFYVALLGGSVCGYARFDSKQGNANISIAILKGYRGYGLACQVIERACKRVFSTTLIECVTACIKNGNAASISTFSKSGFTSTGQGDTETVTMILRK